VIHDTWCRLVIHKFNELMNIIIPLVDSIKNYRVDNLGLITSKANNYKIWKEGIIKHNNKEFAFKTADNKTQSIKRKKRTN